MDDTYEMNNMEELNIMIVGGMMAGVVVFTTFLSSLLYCIGEDI